jgi:monoterpene epsilon-lactone hydrolase
MSKQQLAAILEMSAQNPIPANATPAAMRAWVEDVAGHLPVAENIQIERVNCGPCDGDLILPAGGDSSRLIIFYHGSGFLFGSSRTHRVIASNLARAAVSAVLVPDYRLAPENQSPAAHDDAFAVYQWALKQGYASGKVALSGDSGGRQSGSRHGRACQESRASAACCAGVGVSLAGFGRRRRLASRDAR